MFQFVKKVFESGAEFLQFVNAFLELFLELELNRVLGLGSKLHQLFELCFQGLQGLLLERNAQILKKDLLAGKAELLKRNEDLFFLFKDCFDVLLYFQQIESVLSELSLVQLQNSSFLSYKLL